MTIIELQDLIVRTLVRTEGGSPRRWRIVVGPIKIYDLATHAHCNWSVAPSGANGEVAKVERLLDSLRLSHPIVSG
jgi:hypothetical protein